MKSTINTVLFIESNQAKTLSLEGLTLTGKDRFVNVHLITLQFIETRLTAAKGMFIYSKINP
jgi:hypothetical protein